MKLGEFLREELVKIGLEAETKEEAIEEMIDLLVAEHEIRIRDRSEVLRAVREREQSMSTGIEHGVAIPHGATETVDEVVGALAICKEGIPFDSIDGEPSSIICLLVIPKLKFTRHVRTLAGVAKLMSDPQLRKDLKNSRTPAEAMKFIDKHEAKEFLYDFK
ncbi:MAG: PTS sugar transporter subunit IIA [Planctomycetota bacterium]